MEEKYIEKKPRPGVHVHGPTLYAKVGPQPGGRIHREKYRGSRPGVHDHRLILLAKVGPQSGGRIHREKYRDSP